eukprot:1157308-Pelagomonas_calceolata.AAC.13
MLFKALNCQWSNLSLIIAMQMNNDFAGFYFYSKVNPWGMRAAKKYSCPFHAKLAVNVNLTAASFFIINYDLCRLLHLDSNLFGLDCICISGVQVQQSLSLTEVFRNPSASRLQLLMPDLSGSMGFGQPFLPLYFWFCLDGRMRRMIVGIPLIPITESSLPSIAVTECTHASHGQQAGIHVTQFRNPSPIPGSVLSNVLLPNFRGSTGYGQAFLEALPGHIGHYDVQDCMDAVTWAVQQAAEGRKQKEMNGGINGGPVLDEVT